MPYRNCLIPSCPSKGNNKLYRFPTDNCLADAWNDILVSKFPGIKLSGFKRISQRICELHFEDIFIKFGRRMTNAIPTLFTQEEIRVGMPSKKIDISFEGFEEQNPYPELKSAITGKQSADTKSLTVKSFAPMGVGHDHGYYARTKRIKIYFDGCETTAEDRQERDWVPRRHQEAPKASDRTLIGDKETSDVNDDVALLRMGITLHSESSVLKENNESRAPTAQGEAVEIQVIDNVDSWWAEDQMDGIETVAVANDVTMSPAPRVFSWHRPPEVIPCADDFEIQTDAPLTAPDSAGGDGGDDRRRIETYNDRLHLGHRCNECGSEIVGYRYTCVQCCDVDLCGACEASGAHPEHYVLRLPRPEPAAAVKGLLETLRGLLDHLPLHALHEVKKEEIDDADPLSCEFVPPPPESFNEDDDSEFEEYEENEEPTKEARLSDDELSLTDLRSLNEDFTSNTPTDTANIQNPANEHSPDKVRLDLGNRSSRKVLLRLKKLSEINDDGAVECSVVRPCEGEIEKSGARAASGVSVTMLGAGVTKLGSGVTKLGPGVTKMGPGVTKLRTGVATSWANVTTSEASVISAGAGSRVSGAPVEIPVVKLEKMDDRLLRGEGAWTLIP